MKTLYATAVAFALAPLALSPAAAASLDEVAAAMGVQKVDSLHRSHRSQARHPTFAERSAFGERRRWKAASNSLRVTACALARSQGLGGAERPRARG